MKGKKDLEIKLERTLATTPKEAYSAWLNPKVPGTPWNIGEDLILNPKVRSLFYWLVNGTAHYGRFTQLKRPGTIQHTWMSPYTEGRESLVTVTFAKQGEETLMTLVHTGLPDNANGRAHIGGWTDFLDGFPKSFRKASRKKAKK